MISGIQKVIAKNYFLIIISACVINKCFSSDNFQSSYYPQQVQDPFYVGIDVHCACDKDRSNNWNIINLTYQQYTNILAVVGLPPSQIPSLRQNIINPDN